MKEVMNAYAIPGLKNKNRPNMSNYAMMDIIRRGAVYFKMEVSHLMSRNRKRELVECRMMIMYYLHIELQKTCTLVGANFNLDHSTVLHGTRFIRNQLTINPKMKKTYNEMVMYIEYQK